jgi:uncharacterized membrane protein YgdD (TMEM256/DUF423 family)
MQKTFLFIAALSGALSVALGAFAAHGLKKVLTPADLQVFETGVKYQVYHTLALLAAGILWQSFAGAPLLWAGRLYITGMIIFSGSLYLLCLIRHYGWGATWVGAITPLGGLCLIAGWVLMAVAVASSRQAA